MLTELCRECRNWFTADSDKHSGDFTISDGGITPFDFVLSGQYFRIMGSHFNDGVYKNVPEEVAKLAAETFTGQIWAMRVPPAFIDLSGKIEEYVAKNVPFTAAKVDYTLNIMSGPQVSLVQDFKNNRFYLSDQIVIVNTKEPMSPNGTSDKEDVYPLYKNIGFILDPKPRVRTIYKIIDSWKEIKDWLNNEVIPSINEINDAENSYAAETEKYRKNSVRNFKL